ncbi:uncharacterized protein METZ01_LOCUS172208 [marine metagenome]|uniref:DUF5901 domain-containing protein n=1 Tax=marine metagenome TaxID=408172 RepID=A0A382C0G8_9ZZZZ|tara:strand:- start:11588 stop:13234 length:1647 start_codon:yes stop_codon:yes gene_type:complete
MSDKIFNVFFSQNNYKVLLSVVYEHLMNEYDYSIGDDEEELCVKIMEHIYNNSEPKKNTTSVIDYVKGLNRTTINELIEIIIKKIHNDMSPDKNSIDIPKEPLRNERDNKNMQIQPRQTGSFGNVSEHPSRQNTQFASTSFPGSNRDIINNFEQIQKERNNDQPLKEMKGRNPQFEDQYREDNTKISEDYEKALSERKYQNNENNLETIIEENIEEFDKVLPGMDADTQYSELPTAEQKIALNEPPQPTNLQMLIKQPDIFKKYLAEANKGLTKEYFVVIDSRDRNYDLFSSTSQYEIELNNVYKDIVSIELISAEIPHSGYIINASNNEIHFIETNTQTSTNTYYTATIPQGNYTESELATTIGEQMTTAGQSTYTVTVDTTSRKMSIASNLTGGDNIFSLIFRGNTEKYEDSTRYLYKERSIGSILGFIRNDLSGSASYTGQNQYNINGENYILLHIDNLSNMEGRGYGVSNSFAKITLTSDKNKTRFYNMNEYITKKIFNPPLGKLNQLFIKFKKYDGGLYDFGGIEHSLFFKITTLIQSQGYMV